MNHQQARTLSNQADHYNGQQVSAAGQGPMQLITVWTNICRKIAKDALRNGDPAVAAALADHLNDFYQRYTRSP